MEVIIRPGHEAACKLTAAIIARELAAKPDLVLGLATGRTMEDVYRLLVKMHENEGLDFSLATTFNLDEYIGLAPDDPQSYHQYMRKHLFDCVNLNPERCHVPNGVADDIDRECAEYEAKIRNAGDIDLQLLGIGNTGHIGFNEPLSALRSRTRAKALTPETRDQNAPLFPDGREVPHRAITMGVGTISDAHRCLLLATGDEKAEIIARAVEGPVTSMISATALQLHPRCTVILDEAAASHLENIEYYRWLFENEPEWEPFRSMDG